jgi:small ligand-binding sensory domain FIST
VQFAVAGDGNINGHGGASGVFSGGLSGVAFGSNVGLVSRVTQGCKPVCAAHVITESDRNVVVSLDGEPALDVMLRDLSTPLEQPEKALEVVRATLVGLVRPADAKAASHLTGELGGAAMLPRTGDFGSDVLVRHIIGLDSGRRGIAVSDYVPAGTTLTFCQRSMQAAKADLMRVCSEIREALESESESPTPRHIAGAVYISCSGRGGPHFGGPSAEMHIVRKALGDVPLVGFFAGGEIAHAHLYGYTGVLTVFCTT